MEETLAMQDYDAQELEMRFYSIDVRIEFWILNNIGGLAVFISTAVHS